jgi:hypothetical protein
MKKTQTFLLLLLLLIPSLAVAQTSSSVNAAANRSWPKFYAAFRSAVKKRDSSSLKKMMPSDKVSCACDSGECPPDEMLRGLTQCSLWGWMDKALASGVKLYKPYGEDKGRPAKITREHLGCIFVFRADGKWYFVGLMGD